MKVCVLNNESVFPVKQGLMQLGITLLNPKVFDKLEETQKLYYDVSLKQGIGFYMMKMKKDAAKNQVRRNPNPKQWWKANPITGKVMDRTGALRGGLIEGDRSSQGAWSKLSQKRSYTDPTKLKSLTGVINGKGGGNYIATWSPYIRSGSSALFKYIKANRARMERSRKATIRASDIKKVVAMRFMWEKGIRGQKRTFLEPAHRNTQHKLVRDIKESFGNILLKRYRMIK